MIDFHFHAPIKEFLDFLGEYEESALKYFNAKVEVKGLKEILDYYESFGIRRFVVLPIDSTTFLGRRIPNEVIKADDRIIKFISIDPLKHNAVEELRKLIKEYEPVGVKLHPQLQGFHPLDERALKVYDVINQHGLVTVFHTGTSGIGAGVKSQIRLDYGRPIYFDEIAVRFQDTKIVLAHFGWPWTEEAIAISLHKPNVYLDLSGWAPKYIPDVIWKYAKRLNEKLLFGSDFPLIKPERWVKEFSEVNISQDVKDRILKYNAENLIKAVEHF
ncbi:amidohydrolase [Sulfolobus sp. A20]|uniref:amidohydrolase family protein n=1 Tax=Sulfolobaceae TaxID=118883 RepID=UPI000845E034|nr:MULTISPECIES: amidohydrolase family protein [unclassified Sulfolobus]TRM75688.1 amidohydrolase [Sulfolobus sp. A20-N-F8]TRM78211.1 amidohydrolase [Sulfolobus sp. B5]TRM81897.1 amidohydrolase [Sulfolobus sp. D5]TRM84034.1 amidohydrolase [Sulfolobus sp. A20-N-F6]TRM86881.1 amidohydrolase [Sulfolobus sp. C3]TRN03441.1 amidohydrolase [Sulfolobus sp. F1]TRN03628.1 amidohydrolase [Sulfolobus sp. E1]